jgi:hypothetical protein
MATIRDYAVRRMMQNRCHTPTLPFFRPSPQTGDFSGTDRGLVFLPLIDIFSTL